MLCLYTEGLYMGGGGVGAGQAREGAEWRQHCYTECMEKRGGGQRPEQHTYPHIAQAHTYTMAIHCLVSKVSCCNFLYISMREKGR
jgi:hypothetical protein